MAKNEARYFSQSAPYLSTKLLKKLSNGIYKCQSWPKFGNIQCYLVNSREELLRRLLAVIDQLRTTNKARRCHCVKVSGYPFCISENLSAMVGLFLVNLFMVTSLALSLASRRFLSVLNNASFVFCRCLIDLSISSIAAENLRDAKS